RYSEFCALMLPSFDSPGFNLSRTGPLAAWVGACVGDCVPAYRAALALPGSILSTKTMKVNVIKKANDRERSALVAFTTSSFNWRGISPQKIVCRRAELFDC